MDKELAHGWVREEALRARFEVEAGPDSFGYRRSRKGTYVNPARARDWRMYRAGFLAAGGRIA